METSESNNLLDPNNPLLSNQRVSQSKCAGPKIWIPILILIFIGSIIATVFITISVVENNNNDDAQSSSIPPKNLIVIISDGMGQTYNAAYRQYKNLTRTTIDKHFKGRYSTLPTNKNGITDSAAGATVFACGVKTHNSFLCLDGYGNPKGSILAAAKRQGKGTGMVVTKSVTGK